MGHRVLANAIIAGTRPGDVRPAARKTTRVVSDGPPIADPVSKPDAWWALRSRHPCARTVSLQPLRTFCLIVGLVDSGAASRSYCHGTRG